MGYLVRSLPQRVPIPARPQGKSAQHGRCIPIHFDRPSGGAEEMEKTIAYHQLKGYHLLVNEKLGKSLYTELGNERQILSIPCFVIIDKTGKIVIRHAAAPSEPEKVIEQLSTYYNK